jgi:2-iminobutanoate/2-iminopropanoate deaminase
MKTYTWTLIASLAAAAPAAAQVDYKSDSRGYPFSSAVHVDNVLWLSGEIGSRPDGTLPAGMEAQARQTMDNIARTLKTNGLTYDDVFKCIVMLTDMSQWADFNKVYATYFKKERLPARSAIGANGLALGALVEVECLAYKPRK